MQLKPPFFSVVIPTYERPELLPRALDSVLNAGRADTEIVVVDDGSTSSYEAVKKHYGGGFRYYRNERPLGVSPCRNIGVSQAEGEWVLFLDDDDELAGDYLDRIKRAIESDSSLPAVWTGARIMQRAGTEVVAEERVFPGQYRDTKYLIKDLLSIGLGFGFAIDRSVFVGVGMFDEIFRVGEDTELFFRLVSQGYIPRPLPGVGVIKHEEHKDRLSSDYEIYSRESVYDKIFEKHRDSFASKWRYNYIHMLMWSYRLHRDYGNRKLQSSAFEELVKLDVPEGHIDECYRSGDDLSIEHVG